MTCRSGFPTRIRGTCPARTTRCSRPDFFGASSAEVGHPERLLDLGARGHRCGRFEVIHEGSDRPALPRCSRTPARLVVSRPISSAGARSMPTSSIVSRSAVRCGASRRAVLDPSAGKRHVARPGIADALGALDEEDLRIERATGEDQRHRGEQIAGVIDVLRVGRLPRRSRMRPTSSARVGASITGEEPIERAGLRGAARPLRSAGRIHGGKRKPGAIGRKLRDAAPQQVDPLAPAPPRARTRLRARGRARPSGDRGKGSARRRSIAASASSTDFTSR